MWINDPSGGSSCAIVWTEDCFDSCCICMASDSVVCQHRIYKYVRIGDHEWIHLIMPVCKKLRGTNLMAIHVSALFINIDTTLSCRSKHGHKIDSLFCCSKNKEYILLSSVDALIYQLFGPVPIKDMQTPHSPQKWLFFYIRFRRF